MLAAAQGDREAFGILVERHHCAIVQFVRETSGPDVDRPDARAIDRERAETVRRAVAGLPAGQRAAILLRHFLELSYVEIADVLGTSVSAVESLLFRARLTLRKTANSSESDAPTQVSPALGVE